MLGKPSPDRGSSAVRAPVVMLVTCEKLWLPDYHLSLTALDPVTAHHIKGFTVLLQRNEAGGGIVPAGLRHDRRVMTMREPLLQELEGVRVLGEILLPPLAILLLNEHPPRPMVWIQQAPVRHFTEVRFVNWILEQFVDRNHMLPVCCMASPRSYARCNSNANRWDYECQGVSGDY